MSWTNKQEVNTEKMEIMTYEERRAKIREQVKDRLSQERAFLALFLEIQKLENLELLWIAEQTRKLRKA